MMVDALHDGSGGAERFAAALAGALHGERYEVTLCVTRTAGGRAAEELRDAGIRVLALGRRGRADVVAFRPLVRYLRRERIELVHAHKFGSNVWATILGRLAGVAAIVAHEHTWSYSGQPLRRLLDGKLIGRLASAFVAVSNADRERMIAIEGVPPEKAVVIPTAFVPRPRASGGSSLRAELGIPARAPVVGTVAQLRPQKALHVLIEAFRRIRRRFPDAQLVIVGDGPDRPRLEGVAEAADLDGSVHFTGTRTDLDAVLAAFDVAAMSSDFEGLPLFVFECMAHRTPLVATEVGGIPDVVEDGRTGLLVPPGDAEALGSSLEELLQDRTRAEAIAAAAHERLPEFTLEGVAARFDGLYQRLLREARPSRRRPGPCPSAPRWRRARGCRRAPRRSGP